jgi:hypothetical protein
MSDARCIVANARCRIANASCRVSNARTVVAYARYVVSNPRCRVAIALRVTNALFIGKDLLGDTSCWGTVLKPKSREKKPVIDFGYPRACTFRKYQKNRLSELRLPTFFKTWFLIHKCGWNWQKWPKMEFFDFFEKVSFLDCIRSKNFSNLFHDLKNVKIAKKKF